MNLTVHHLQRREPPGRETAPGNDFEMKMTTKRRQRQTEMLLHYFFIYHEKQEKLVRIKPAWVQILLLKYRWRAVLLQP